MALAHHRHKLSALMRRRIYMVRTMLALILVTLVFAVLGGLSLSLQSSAAQTFASKELGMAFEYPATYTLSMTTSGVTLSLSNDPDKKILMSSYGSQFSDTKSHVEASINRKQMPVKLRLEYKRDVGINGELVEYMYMGAPYRIYYFVKDYAVYQLETSSPSLFSDLDAIAQSFRIIP